MSLGMQLVIFITWIIVGITVLAGLIIGGFHVFDPDSETKETIDFVKTPYGILLVPLSLSVLIGYLVCLFVKKVCTTNPVVTASKTFHKFMSTPINELINIRIKLERREKW